jgi:hypothetical protein
MPPAFKISRVPRATEQMRDLVRRASALGMRAELAAALLEITERLQNDPLQFGEPSYNTHKPGGVVCTAVVQPLKVTFAVFDTDKVVFLLDVSPMPRSPLEAAESN